MNNPYRVELSLQPNELSVRFEIFDNIDGDPIADGYVKWDGCMDWQTAEGFMMHLCDPSGAEEFMRLLVSMWARARPMMSKAIF